MSDQERVRAIRTVLMGHVADILQAARSCTVPGGIIVLQLHDDFSWVGASCVAANTNVPRVGPEGDIFIKLNGPFGPKVTDQGVRMAIANGVK